LDAGLRRARAARRWRIAGARRSSRTASAGRSWRSARIPQRGGVATNLPSPPEAKAFALDSASATRDARSHLPTLLPIAAHSRVLRIRTTAKSDGPPKGFLSLARRWPARKFSPRAGGVSRKASRDLQSLSLKQACAKLELDALVQSRWGFWRRTGSHSALIQEAGAL